MSKPRPRFRATVAKTRRPCPVCGRVIMIGEMIREREHNGRIVWAHGRCPGHTAGWTGEKP